MSVGVGVVVETGEPEAMSPVPGARHTLRDLLGELDGLRHRVGTGLDGALDRGVGVAPTMRSATTQPALSDCDTRLVKRLRVVGWKRCALATR
jgi:hypothetical protein